MRALREPLKELKNYASLREAIRSPGLVSFEGLLDSQKVHFLSSMAGDIPWKLLIAPSEAKGRELYEDLRFYDRHAWYYPAKDLLFFSADIHGNLLVRQRLRVVKALMMGEGGTVVCPIDACLDVLSSMEEMRASLLKLRKGESYELGALRKQLVSLGYEAVEEVDLPGQFAVRGGIMDIYCPTEDDPWRLEFWGDEVDSIRSFDSTSQRSLEEMDQVIVFPGLEKVLEREEGVSFLDYFPPDAVVFLDEIALMASSAQEVSGEYLSSVMHRAEKGETNLSAQWIFPVEDIQERLCQMRSSALSGITPVAGAWKIKERIQLQGHGTPSYRGSFEMLLSDLKSYKEKGYRTVLLSASTTRAKRLAGDLTERGVTAFYSMDENRVLKKGEIMVTFGHSRQGFLYPEIGLALLTETDIFGREHTRVKKRKHASGDVISSFSDLNVGDYVIHQRHGVGRYKGIEKVEVEGTFKDFIKVEYAQGGAVLVPATQLDKLQKHSDAKSEVPPKLNSLGGTQWRKVRDKVKAQVKNIAIDLVRLYALRQEGEGYACGPDTVWQQEFEELFPYEETADQLKAIEDTKRDMESHKIMDRLICGDVGYGKTEIALRAAFKEVQENRQVVYLVPTTILAQQHYNTFSERMKDFPVRVELLSRFRSQKEQKQVIEDLKKGLVDVVIGTHRVLSKDVVYKNLGLLIIDEEQRFGVRHKEKIKELRKEVDVLTLTATPIPRTLHMSLIGIRDMSLLEEPPMDRVPIQTYVMPFDEETVREAISRELRRHGQVFYVYNRVETIADVAALVKSLVPDARVGYAHGQMSEKELEDVMLSFINADLDVLVSTTIIETGLDISNVNTMIIHDSDRYGLSQLYQLRGRIGRSNRTAYCFLMYKQDKELREVAQKRLSAIREFTDLGSGFKIAMRDLELRGAGDLLGASQHGHMEAVGYDLYVKMLSEAIKEAQGLEKEESFDTTVDLAVNAFIPEAYVNNEYLKLNLYKRFALISSQSEYDELYDELLDRFGEPPLPVMNLLKVALLRAKAHMVYVTDVKQKGREVNLFLYENAKLEVSHIPAFLNRHRWELSFVKEGRPRFVFKPKEEIFGAVVDLVDDMCKSLLPEEG